jgi:nucleoside-diphosphate-sugar epimerase
MLKKNNKIKILLTGGDGYISKTLFEKLKNTFDITKISRKDFDLTDPFETLRFFSNKYFDVVIHCAIVGGSRLKEDDSTVTDNNLRMYYNLLNCENKFGRFINIGSGAEIYYPETPYGLSKKVILTSVLNKNNFYSIRIFGLFDENETETRFIKSNILRYIMNEPLVLYENKEMDFFYMEDFTRLVKHFIFNDKDILPKIYDCTYNKTFKTIEILEMINNLSESKSPIINDFLEREKYSGEFIDLGIEYIGLEQGIKNTFKILKKKHD